MSNLDIRQQKLCSKDEGQCRRSTGSLSGGRAPLNPILLDPAETGFVETLIQPQDNLHLVEDEQDVFSAADRSASWAAALSEPAAASPSRYSRFVRLLSALSPGGFADKLC